MYWIFSFPFKIMMISAPLVYWWTGTAVVSSSVGQMIYWLAPAAFSSIAFMSLYASNRVLPVMTDVTQLLSTFVVIRTVTTGLVKPFGRPFKVTAKGVSNDRVTVQWGLMLPFVLLAAGTALGVAVNLSPFSPLHGTPGFSLNVFWSLFNVAVLMLTAAICVELPRRRTDERFLTHEPASILHPDGMLVPCTLSDISLGGALVLPEQPQDPATLAGSQLILDDGRLYAPIAGLRTVGDSLALRFVESPELRRTLIAKLFTGNYRNDVPIITIRHVAAALARRLVG
jgi:cellulose synthase (UDP-forming)